MRLRYSLTSDIQDVPRHVKQQLESHVNKTNLDSKIYKIIGELGEKKINFVGLEQEILWLRQELVVLDQLLIESADILKACDKAEKGEVETHAPLPEAELEEPQDLKQEDKITQKDEKDMVSIQNSFAQLNNMAKTFKEMKESNKEKYKT